MQPVTLKLTEPPVVHQIPFNTYKLKAINSIKNLYENLRSRSKNPTFALTYDGTYRTLMEQGFSEEEAKDIYNKYHALYSASTIWVKSHIDTASRIGYVIGAFGLRLRTPTLTKVILNSRFTPYEAIKQARTAGNALGQSWGLLNNRAAIELRDRIKDAGLRGKILPCMHIHDAQYFLVRNELGLTKWLADNISECMLWNDDPLIYHEDVQLGGELDLFIPNWTKGVTIKPDTSIQDIHKQLRAHHESRTR